MRLVLAVFLSLITAACAPIPVREAGKTAVAGTPESTPETGAAAVKEEPVPAPEPGNVPLTDTPTPVPDAGKTTAAEPPPSLPTPADTPESVKEEPPTMDNASAAQLTPEDRERMKWDKWVHGEKVIWISVPDQRLRLVEDGQVTLEMKCATALNGIGARLNTNQTPPGWHRVSDKIGEGEPMGRVFRSRGATSKIWREDEAVPEDLVLTRIFILEGLEPGINQGKDKEGFVVDSLQRLIYIHGTNAEEFLGTPSSKGCIRLSNNDVITLFKQVPVGTLVYIDPPDAPAQEVPQESSR